MIVTILDDHTLVLEALKLRLETTPGIDNVVAFDNPDTFLAGWNTQQPDLIILDIDYGEKTRLDGFIIFETLINQGFKGKVIFLSANLTMLALQKVLQLGAAGFIGKDSSFDELDEALKTVSQGQVYLGRSLDPLVRQLVTRQKKSELSLRELEVIRLITQGLSYKEIGEKLFISPRTVEAHKNHILGKLRLSNVIELVRYALKNKLV